MAKIKRYTALDGGYNNELGFFCPGCKCRHFINDNKTTIPNLPDSHIWQFNGDYDHPTISTSILTRRYVWNPKTKKHNLETGRCHSYITDGQIRFLPDCMHDLAGQTVELPEIN